MNLENFPKSTAKERREARKARLEQFRVNLIHMSTPHDTVIEPTEETLSESPVRGQQEEAPDGIGGEEADGILSSEEPRAPVKTTKRKRSTRKSTTKQGDK